ncbi:hypothetical protein GDO78_016154 [Eleutherodactylus coqui]|uniref:Uncharacterized protein n=1 Tax=Eleutherodactylus coqui TaxID=57060 RepID=A0A8J6BB49_ELECQ|nr:hypothetical protein GDO78_016154 [Eleutherodactylus coqui]
MHEKENAMQKTKSAPCLSVGSWSPGGRSKMGVHLSYTKVSTAVCPYWSVLSSSKDQPWQTWGPLLDLQSPCKQMGPPGDDITEQAPPSF